ncbi:hypothetical protein ACWPE7_001043 [Campylobacter upsaliensis]|nr:hypothetical protein [Campylobacter jejuni]HBD9204932.1 hypothetical protein [Campylobacter jejuni]HDZ4962986.1 hypothetical protein [Campylobacter jejuni]HDZ4984724.1 hypothetical protein [Campylobacter jejuni]HDZ4989829.1 hypothetical protein [Campylobacter jejuni]
MKKQENNSSSLKRFCDSYDAIRVLNALKGETNLINKIKSDQQNQSNQQNQTVKSSK